MTSRVLSLCIAGVTFVSGADREVFKNRAPVSPNTLRVKLPKAAEFRLSNGLTVLVIEGHHLPRVSMTLEIRGAGTVYDPSDMAGLAVSTARLSLEGTTTRSSRQIAEEMDRLGVRITVAAEPIHTVLSASGLSDNFDQWLALWADLLLHPTLPAGEWTRMRQRQTAGLMQARGNPSFLATELFRRAVYGNHPAGRTAPTAASLAAITPEVIASWHRERYAPQHSILGVAGDVRPRDLQEKLERALASWKNTGSSPQPFENPPAPTATQVFLAHRPGAIQTNLTIGNLAIDRRSPDFFAMTVMNQVLGADPASRLYTNLREDKGYTYGAYSSFTPGEIVGPWYVSTDVRTGVTEAALREIFLELKRMREEKVPVKELEEKKRAIVSRLAFSVENPQELLKYALTCKSFQLTGDYWETFPQKIAAVTAEDVQLVAKKYLGVDDIQIVAIGDAAQIKGTLEKYGKVTVFSPDGPTAQ